MKSFGFRSVALVIGLLLLFTASLKTDAAFADMLVERSFFTSRKGLLIIAEFELFLGAWLISGLRPAVARRCALVTFTCFLGFSLASSLAGERSCSCFGNLAVSPWFASTIDLVAVGILLMCKPQTNTSFVVTTPMRKSFLILIFIVPLAVPPILASCIDTHSALLVPSEQSLDLGIVSMGGRRSATLCLTNKEVNAVEVKTVLSSCPCLKLRCPSQVVRPSETIRTLITLDLEEEPAFVGNLRITLQGRTQTGALAFSVQVRAKVQKP